MLNKIEDKYIVVESEDREEFSNEVAKMHSHNYTLVEYSATDSKYTALMYQDQ